ncbi:MAG: aldo/keto reductase [Phycisphaeraceae bacterium]|nr:aldo/keto reductase [Phycisphaeraceae bacterium]
MEPTLLGKTDLSVSRLGFGAAPIGFLGTPQGQTGKLVAMLLDAGLNLFDTAPMYVDAEQKLGQALDGRRDEAVLVSKCGTADDELPGEAWSAELITATIDRSLKRLKTDRLDLTLLHSCGLDVLQQGEAAEALIKAREAGKTTYLGYSGDNEAAAAAAGMDWVDVIETSVNICDQHNIEHVLPACAEHNVGVIAKRPIANAAWNPLNKQRGLYKEYARVYHDRLKQMNIAPNELGYHGHAEVEWPEIALKFTLAIEGVDAAIVGTTSTVNATANIDAVRKNPLREQVVNKLRQAFKDAERASGGPWLGQI